MKFKAHWFLYVPPGGTVNKAGLCPQLTYMYVWWGNLTNRNHVEDLRVVRRIILKLIFMRWDVARTEIISKEDVPT